MEKKNEILDSMKDPKFSSSDVKTVLEVKEDGLVVKAPESEPLKPDAPKRSSLRFLNRHKHEEPTFDYTGLKDIEGRVLKHTEPESTEKEDPSLRRSVKFVEEGGLTESMVKKGHGSILKKSSQRNINVKRVSDETVEKVMGSFEKLD